MKNIELSRVELRGRPFDYDRCFHIKDFRKGDSIRVKTKRDQKFVRGVVTSVDLDNNVISFKTAESERNETTIDYIVSLEEYKRNFLGQS
jgi:small nuclear ribonucleoprotein (snRNP)-like protein